jgi:hypothetical protein
MWLFTPNYFVSIVNKPGDKNLCVRGRVVADLESFRMELFKTTDPGVVDGIVTLDGGETLTVAAYLDKFWPIEMHTGTDYVCRLYAEHGAVAEVLYAKTASIDYGNFKNRVKKVQGATRASAYMRVWSAMMDVQNAALRTMKQATSRAW